MRRLAVLAIVLGGCAASAAAAQPGVAPGPAGRLAQAAFAGSAAAPEQQIGEVLDRHWLAGAAGAADWASGELRLASSAKRVDTLRVRVVAPLRTAGGLPLDLSRAGSQPQAYEVSLVRSWPGAIAFATRRFGLELSPHAALGLTSFGGAAEAGATLEFGRRLDDAAAERLMALGVRDGAAFGDRGRWYLFAAASGRAVGWNMLRNGAGWDRAGWTTDPASTLIGDAQLGVAWRRGAMQTSFGVLRREVKGQHMLFGQETIDDSLVAFSFAVKPRR